MSREEPELLTDIRDFTPEFYVILGRKLPRVIEACDLQYGALT